jgi:hypothetical protein
VWLAGCGGRVAHPVAATTPLDDQLSCDHLRSEREVNDARIADLRKEKRNSQDNDAGLILAAPLLLDVSDSEEKEIAAFQARNKVLDDLIAKKCTQSAK